MKKLILISALLWANLYSFSQDSLALLNSSMRAHFIDVGQADATLLEFPCGAILIDAGGQDSVAEANLIKYLDEFFTRRKDLNKSLDLVVITHAHVDHNSALQEVAARFKIRNYIDNGRREGSGRRNQKWMQDNARSFHIKYEKITTDNILFNGSMGYTDEIVDPIACPVTDPVITVFAGGLESRASSWSNSDYKNGNNHSLVVKVAYGKSSFLFTGDLETKGISDLIKTYRNTNLLDVDILRVGHHGAANAITQEYLKMVTPKYSVISCGRWDFGRVSATEARAYTTYAYGHPRASTINLLSSHMTQTRSPSVNIRVADRPKAYRDLQLVKGIYLTPADGSVVIEASAMGTYRVRTSR